VPYPTIRRGHARRQEWITNVYDGDEPSVAEGLRRLGTPAFDACQATRMAWGDDHCGDPGCATCSGVTRSLDER
jgi:hypothetical protein